MTGSGRSRIRLPKGTAATPTRPESGMPSSGAA